MDQKGHIIDQKGLKFVDLKYQNFSGVFLREICKYSKWKFKMVFSMKGGVGGSTYLF